MTSPTWMEREAREAPQVAAKLVEASDTLKELADQLCLLKPAYALAAGRGSSDAAALFAKYLFEMRLGLPTVSAAPSIRSIYGRRLNLEQALLLAISQSGQSPDLLEFCRAASGKNVLRVGLINDLASPLAAAVDICLPLLAGREQSVAATKSCLSAMTLVFGLTAHWAKDADMIAAFKRAPEALAEGLSRSWPGAEEFLAGEGPVYVIGRGPGLAIAAEAALKLKETCAIHAEAVSSAEVRHGPFALAGPHLRVIVLAQQDAAFEGLRVTAAELAERGCPVMFISSEPALSKALIRADQEPVLELLQMLARFYLLANATALSRGRSPDHPPMLSKVTETR